MTPMQHPRDAQMETVRKLTLAELKPKVREIDQQGFYPLAFLRSLGKLGGFSAHATDPAGLATTIRTMTEVGRYCGSTAFLLWCQNTCVWFLANTDNGDLQDRYLSAVARAEQIGASAFSNTMKHYDGFESLKLAGKKVPGGYVVNGTLPWVSNLDRDHVFCTTIATDNGNIAALATVNGQSIRTGPCGTFAGLNGSATYSLKFENALIPDTDLLAEPADPFVEKIRAGFVLLQLGIGFGVIHGALDDITQANHKLAHANRFLPDSFESLTTSLAFLETRAQQLAQTPLDENPGYLQSVLQLRLETAELANQATLSALQHAGALGFLADSAPQRRLREALFLTIVSPSIKHLRKALVGIQA